MPILKQPNGKYAIYSGPHDIFREINITREEMIEDERRNPDEPWHSPEESMQSLLGVLADADATLLGQSWHWDRVVERYHRSEVEDCQDREKRGLTKGETARFEVWFARFTAKTTDPDGHRAEDGCI